MHPISASPKSVKAPSEDAFPLETSFPLEKTTTARPNSQRLPVSEMPQVDAAREG